MWNKKSSLRTKVPLEEINENIERIKWIEYKNNKILYIDYSNILSTDELLTTIEKANDFIKNYQDNKILIIVDTRNSVAKEKIAVDALKNSAIIVKPHVKKAAVVGISKSQEVILTLVNMFSNLGLKPFDTMDNAKEWLTQ
jgi:hypothetical protein